MANMMALLRTPNQAANIYSQSGGFPKQRHTFLVRFHANNGQVMQSMTFAVKAVDRPTVQPHTEELNQYNKKRHIYTNYKLAPIKISFYDTADQAAMKMWAQYSRYYFGDFSQHSANSFSGSDIIGNTLNDPSGNYGFTAKNGNSKDTDSQYFFKTIEIIHVHGNQFDLYELVHPRISAFDPDELDYEQAAVSVINTQFVYEALLFVPNAGPASSLSELQSGAPFDAQSNLGPDITNNNPTTRGTSMGSNTTHNNQLGAVESLFGDYTGQSMPNLPGYRFNGNQSNGSGLGIFGNFLFGPSNKSPMFANQNSPGLLSALGLGQGGNALTSLSPFVGNQQSGIPPQLLNRISSMVGSSGNGSGPFAGDLVKGLLSGSLGSSSGNIPAGFNSSGLALSASGYGMINAQRPGTSQVGFNPSSTTPESNAITGPSDLSLPVPPIPPSTQDIVDERIAKATPAPTDAPHPLPTGTPESSTNANSSPDNVDNGSGITYDSTTT